MTLVALGKRSTAPASPDWVRISYASALALRFKSGRFAPAHGLAALGRPTAPAPGAPAGSNFDFGGINLLLHYGEGCQSDCGYCGLARSRRGTYEDKSFIRVEWPLVETDELVARMARHEAKLTRLCISMVTHGHAYRDTLEITRRIRARVATPLSILVAPPTLDRERLQAFHDAGVDMIGIGLDAVTEELFRSLRTDVPKGRLEWANYWRIVDAARDIFGPWKVNCHTLVGLGESDRDLMALFARLVERQIFSYLFCFNPEPDSRLADHPKSTLTRWRRVQLAKFLLEERGLPLAAFAFADDGALAGIAAAEATLDEAIADGHAFMTNGCPGENGEPGCTRPMGSWRPAEPPRDFPWRPEGDELVAIREALRLEEVVRPPVPRAGGPRVPPVAGRVPANLRRS